MPIADDLERLQLISGPKIKEIFNNIYPDILTIQYNSESDFIQEMWVRYTQGNPSLNGSVFEGLLAVMFFRSGILPLYIQAKLSFVPNVEFDFIAYSKEYGPIVLSAKTSLRERYKQADLEGMMLRQVHRKSKSFLITLNEIEAGSVNAKIKMGEVLGLDSVVLANCKKFDNLIKKLKSLTLFKPEMLDVVTSARFIDKSLKGDIK